MNGAERITIRLSTLAMIVQLGLPGPIPALAADGVMSGQGRCRDRISAPPVRFSYDSTRLDTVACCQLDSLAERLTGCPGQRVILTGHTDDRGSDEYTLAVGERMARAVGAYLVKDGVAPERITMMSNGRERPVDRRHTAAARDRNRRVEIEVIPGT